MAADEALLDAARQFQLPMLRLYSWTEPAASFGYFQAYGQVAALTSLRPLIRRPTGGGLVPHDRDWTYSLAIPRNHAWFGLSARESYRQLHAWIQEAFQNCGVPTRLSERAFHDAPGQCFAGAECDDLLWEGKKIAGAAQRRTKFGLLVQGSIQPPPGVERARWEQAFSESTARSRLGTGQSFQWPQSMRSLIEGLVERKYGTPEFNRKR